MTKEIFSEEELENLAEEARDKAVIKALDDMKSRYKALFGTDPDINLPVAEIQEKIRAALPRPFRL